MKGQHVNSRKLAGASAASVGAATAVAALLLGTLSGFAGEEPSSRNEIRSTFGGVVEPVNCDDANCGGSVPFRSATASAFGIAAEGLVPISPTPYVQAPPDGHRALLEVPGPQRDGLFIGLLRVEAERYRAKAQAVNLDVLGLKLRLIEAYCDHGHGGSSIIGRNGEPLPYSEGGSLNLSPLVRVDFDRHHRDHDKLTVDAAVVTLLPGDRRGMVITPKDLGLFQSLAPKSLKVPTMDQLEAAHAKSADVKSAKSPATKSAPAAKSSPDIKSPDTKSPDTKSADNAFSEPSKSPSEGSDPTVEDLVKELEALNPSLTHLTDGPRALEVIVISSASCREERHEGRPPEHKQEAPPPHPVKTHLPVTH
jgi:hypothetical protein